MAVDQTLHAALAGGFENIDVADDVDASAQHRVGLAERNLQRAR